ncbi:MAG: PAS domain S-box protein [Verrucomicrobia bacterium]|nr:PAS domain S-box protein [Verrucomicrobiota bacterium]
MSNGSSVGFLRFQTGGNLEKKDSKPREDGLPAAAPDLVEDRQRELIDNIVPTLGYSLIPMVGLGGSAGSIAALQEFFKAMPADSGMTFVVVVHLASDFASTLPEMLARCTRMPVTAAEDGVKVEPNHVYVIPPGKYLAVLGGHLRLTTLEHERGKRVAVDLFFRSLADSHGPHAAAIVLSGADGDGTIGIKRIKERGGLTIAQDPEEAEHHGMPQSAIGTGMVDWVLRAAKIPQHLLEYRARGQHLRVPPEEGPPRRRASEEILEEGEAALRELLAYLRSRTGHEFSYYKRATIVRRISRRLQINGVADVPAYLTFLRKNPGEVGALLQDLLISVTNFFRDRESFGAISFLVPELFRGKEPGDFVRVWVPACATGEEAYSIAMLLLEHADTLEAAPGLQIFGSDLDEGAIQIARKGNYPEAIAADVSEERLRRFFAKEAGGYQIRREVRERVLFTTHDLLKDAPFSRLDLISCRNLLIYLNAAAQKRALDIFHFALRPHGLLFMGSSESVEEGSQLFHVVDKKHRIYVQQPASHPRLPVLIEPSTGLHALEVQERPPGRLALWRRSFDRTASTTIELPKGLEHLSPSELHYRLVERLAQPSVLVNPDHEIVHLSEQAGRFLQFGGGAPTMNLLHLVHPALRLELHAALFKATETGLEVDVPRVPLEVGGVTRWVGIRVQSARELAPGFLLVVFETRETTPEEATGIEPLHQPAMRHLERELEVLKIQLRDSLEQYEANTEELKAGNEELQAMNEELRSASEELETSREELQSINEELTTVNQELKSKLEELGRANSDLHNLMASTAIPTIFLDRELRITRYTPSAVGLFQIIPSDLGRPLFDLQHQLDYPELKADAESVLESLVPIEHEASSSDGRWFLARLLPYRTLEDQIAGVVLTLVNITVNKQAEQALQAAHARTKSILESTTDCFYALDRDWRFTYVNPRTEAYFGMPKEQILGRLYTDVLPKSRGHEVLLRQQRTMAEGRPDHFEFLSPTTGKWIEQHVFPNEDGLAVYFRDVTERRCAQEALRESEEWMRLVTESVREYAIVSMDLDRHITSWNAGAQRLLGYDETEILGCSADVIFTEEDRDAGVPAQEAAIAMANGHASDERWHVRKEGIRFWGSGAMMAMHNLAGETIGLVKIFRDNTEVRETQRSLEASRRKLEDALQEAEKARAEAEAAGQAKDHFLAVLSHELRTPLVPVLMGVGTLGRQPGLPPVATEVLQMVERNVQLEARFIEDLLDLTRIRRGKLELVRMPIDLHEVVHHAVSISAEDMEAKKQRLILSLEAGEHSVNGDAIRLQQVLWNLLKNASKFTPGGGEIRARSYNEPVSPEAGTKIIVEISDTGIGFEPEAAERIFDAFTQAGETIASKFGGLGLGLAIAKAIVEGHGGVIRGYSAGLDQGATFTLELPLA